MDEKKITEGIKNGSYKDFTALYELYFSKLYGFVYKLTKSKSVTQEIVQETFVKIWTNRKQLDVHYSIQSYIFTIAKNKLLNEIRNTIGNKHFEDYMNLCNSIDFSENETEENIDIEHFTKKIKHAKTVLTPRQLEIYELNKENGLSVEIIASKFNITEQSVRSQLSIAIKALKRELQK
jgi:RNA polymerase sigma-70 factor (ECF subfamily)